MVPPKAKRFFLGVARDIKFNEYHHNYRLKEINELEKELILAHRLINNVRGQNNYKPRRVLSVEEHLHMIQMKLKNLKEKILAKT